MKLTEYPGNELWSGTIFRFPAKWPFEETVDFMLAEYPHTESGFAMYCVSGYHAGTLEFLLPEAAANTSSRSVSTRWMVEHWREWVYAECGPEEAEVIE